MDTSSRRARPVPSPPPGTNDPNRPATVGMVLGLIAVGAAQPFLVVGIIGLVFSSIGISRANGYWRSGFQPVGRSQARVGLWTSIVSIVIGLLVLPRFISTFLGG